MVQNAGLRVRECGLGIIFKIGVRLSGLESPFFLLLDGFPFFLSLFIGCV